MLRIFQQLFGLVRITILACILSPNDFGMMGVATLTMSILEIFSQTGFQQALGYRTPAEVYSVAAGTPVALRAPSVPTALIHGDEPTLKTPVFCLDNG